MDYDGKLKLEIIKEEHRLYVFKMIWRMVVIDLTLHGLAIIAEMVCQVFSILNCKQASGQIIKILANANTLIETLVVCAVSFYAVSKLAPKFRLFKDKDFSEPKIIHFENEENN